MTIVGLHPEELFDKLLDGEINSAERERLRLHLEACDVCRFEYAARLDFHDEALSSALEGPPPLSPLRAPLPAASPPRRRRHRRSRRVVWGLAAAALITASGALASVVSGAAPWRAMSLVFSQAATLASQPAPAAKSAPRTHGGCKGADCVAVSKPAAQTEAASPAFAAPARVRGAGSAVSARAGSAPSVVSKPARGSSTGAREATPVSTLAPIVEEPRKEAAEEQPAAKEPTTSAKLFGAANQARRAGDVGRASGLYHLLQEQFPGSAEAELSRVTLALLLLDSGDAQGALSGFERYLAGASRGLEAEALVGRARALGRLGRRDLEATAWQEVQRKYPRSIYGRQATERLSALGLP
jgi:TolA-binding protein